MTFIERLVQRIQATRTPLIVGLDPRWQSLPDNLRKSDDLAAQAKAYEQFCCEIIDVVAPLVPAVKPQVAFFEQLGVPGMQALHAVIAKAREAELLVIADGKRGDIGSTAEAYAAAWLGASSPWQADALTVSPYLGEDTLEPFAEASRAHDAGLFVLVKTSNPGSGGLQDLETQGQPVYRQLAAWVEKLAIHDANATGFGSIGAVVGATYPEQLAELREAMPSTFFLVPGFGAQGGRAEDLAQAFNAQGLGAVVNSSRGIIFAHRREEYASRFDAANWQRAVEAATLASIEQLRAVANP